MIRSLIPAITISSFTLLLSACDPTPTDTPVSPTPDATVSPTADTTVSPTPTTSP
jgi:hypothetical protein